MKTVATVTGQISYQREQSPLFVLTCFPLAFVPLSWLYKTRVGLLRECKSQLEFFYFFFLQEPQVKSHLILLGEKLVMVATVLPILPRFYAFSAHTLSVTNACV